MNTVEEQLKENVSFPRFYRRYVDDCLAIVQAEKVDDTLKLFNSICPEIQFTIEMETNNSLPFLDLLLTRIADGSIDFDIYRKDTCTDRYIPIESNQHFSHRVAAFNSMIHRLINVPLTPEKFDKEKNNILRIADINGVNASIIHSLIKKHRRAKTLIECTSLGERVERRWCAMTYSAHNFNAISKSFAKHNTALAPKTTTKLKSLLHTTKDKRDNNEKPGVYKVCCSKCGAVYIGQTRRALKVRMKEHMLYIRNCEAYRSGIAEHSITHKHELCDDDFSLIETESNANRLNILESLHIYMNPNNVNRDTGPHFSSLFFALKR